MFSLALLVMVISCDHLANASSLPLRIAPVVAVVNGSEQNTCPSEDHSALLRASVMRALSAGLTEDNPARSCHDLLADSSSGFYWIQPSVQPPVQVYCDFNRQCGCDTPGSTWTRAAFLNMSDPTHSCPNNWTHSLVGEHRVCFRRMYDITACNSAFYPTFGLEYSRVCGRVQAYQSGTTDALQGVIGGGSVENVYLDGVSITYGSAGSRQHVWSFASALGDVGEFSPNLICDCTSSNVWPYTTGFIGNDYFCDSGNHGNAFPSSFMPYPDDPLWDGEGCDPTSSCCQFNNPPWFCKSLPQYTTDDIEVRICHSGDGEYTPVELIEIYIQ